MNIMELVTKRRSVRTFDGKGITAADYQKLSDYLERVENPYGISVKFRLVDAKEQKMRAAIHADERKPAAKF